MAPDALARWALACDALAATTRKLEKRAILAAYLVTLPLGDAARAALYVAGQPFAEVDRRNLNMGGSLLSKAVALRTGADATALTAAFRRHGDIGAAAADLVATHRPEPPEPPAPTLGDLEAMLGEVAVARGPAAKLRLLERMLARCSAAECKYLCKLISGDMRIGVKQSLVEEAIAAAFNQEVAAVRHAGMLLGSLPEVVQRAAAGTLQEAAMRLFHPLGFMLASPVDSVEEAVSRFAEEVTAEHRAEPASDRAESEASGATSESDAQVDAALAADTSPEQLLREAQLEDKYDGMRAQLHAGDPRERGRVGLFSRNREDLSAAFPELIEAFAALEETVILDGEILAWSPAPEALPNEPPLDAGLEAPSGPDSQDGRALPFSALQQRLGRKQVSAELRRTRPVVFMAFDILYADGRLLLDQPLSARRARLERYLAEHGPSSDGRAAERSRQGMLFADEQPQQAHFPRLLLAPAILLRDAEQLDRAYGEARARGNEGVMLKASHSLYQPGRRGLAWLKLKRELATLDVVVTGAEFGTGRRAGYLSDYTFAVRGAPDADGEPGPLLNVGKAYSGVTDAEMHALSAHFHGITLEEFGSFRTVEPDTIFEVAFNNITRSNRHASGFALRFPRILRIRTDKPLSEIDTLARVETIYNEQPDRPVEPSEPLPSRT
ncbi:ATP-dependent DNA ligase [Acidipila sp. EB88]|nr:ATP-dependent DNA ligase [Acidipila sp. EB88]